MVVLAALVLAAPRRASAADLERAARQAVAAKQFADAREIYARLAAGQPHNAEYLGWMARLSAWLGQYPRAIGEYDRALALAPRDVDLLIGKATVLMWDGRYEQAQLPLDQAAAIQPSNPELLLAYARFHHFQGRDDDALRYVNRALEIDPGDAAAAALKPSLVPSRPFELRLGYQHDWFTFFTPGNMGSASVGYIGKTAEARLIYEFWDRFGKNEYRLGPSFIYRFGRALYLRAGLLYAPGGATVIPRQDYDVGASVKLPGGFVPSLDYRFLHFSTADVHIVNPSLEYYFERPIWIAGRFYQTWTEFPQGGSTGTQSYLIQYNQQFIETLTTHIGYAYGNESFSLFTSDRLGQFTAKTIFGGAAFELSRDCKLAGFYSYQARSDNQQLDTFSVSLTIRR